MVREFPNFPTSPVFFFPADVPIQDLSPYVTNKEEGLLELIAKDREILMRCVASLAPKHSYCALRLMQMGERLAHKPVSSLETLCTEPIDLMSLSSRTINDLRSLVVSVVTGKPFRITEYIDQIMEVSGFYNFDFEHEVVPDASAIIEKISLLDNSSNSDSNDDAVVKQLYPPKKFQHKFTLNIKPPRMISRSSTGLRKHWLKEYLKNKEIIEVMMNKLNSASDNTSPLTKKDEIIRMIAEFHLKNYSWPNYPHELEYRLEKVNHDSTSAVSSGNNLPSDNTSSESKSSSSPFKVLEDFISSQENGLGEGSKQDHFVAPKIQSAKKRNKLTIRKSAMNVDNHEPTAKKPCLDDESSSNMQYYLH